MFEEEDTSGDEVEAKWSYVMKRLELLYEAWAKSATPWHEEVSALMRAYDEWLGC